MSLRSSQKWLRNNFTTHSCLLRTCTTHSFPKPMDTPKQLMWWMETTHWSVSDGRHKIGTSMPAHIPWTITVLEEGYKLVTSWHRQCSSCSLINPCNVEDTCHTALHSYPPYATTVEREATHWSLPDTGDAADAEGTCCRLAVGRKSSEMLTWRLFEVCSLSRSPGKIKCVKQMRLLYANYYSADFFF